MSEEVWVRSNGYGFAYSFEANTPCRFADDTYGPVSAASFGDVVTVGREPCTILEMRKWRVSTVVTAGSEEDARQKVKTAKLFREDFDWFAVPVET